MVWEGTNEEFAELTNEINQIGNKIKLKEEIGGVQINYLALNIKIECGVCLLYTSRCV